MTVNCRSRHDQPKRLKGTNALLGFGPTVLSAVSNEAGYSKSSPPAPHNLTRSTRHDAIQIGAVPISGGPSLATAGRGGGVVGTMLEWRGSRFCRRTRFTRRRLKRGEIEEFVGIDRLPRPAYVFERSKWQDGSPASY